MVSSILVCSLLSDVTTGTLFASTVRRNDTLIWTQPKHESEISST